MGLRPRLLLTPAPRSHAHGQSPSARPSSRTPGWGPPPRPNVDLKCPRKTSDHLRASHCTRSADVSTPLPEVRKRCFLSPFFSRISESHGTSRSQVEYTSKQKADESRVLETVPQGVSVGSPIPEEGGGSPKRGSKSPESFPDPAQCPPGDRSPTRPQTWGLTGR